MNINHNTKTRHDRIPTPPPRVVLDAQHKSKQDIVPEGGRAEAVLGEG